MAARRKKHKWGVLLPIVFLVLSILLFLIMLFGKGYILKNNVSITTTSNLEKLIDIEELSTAKYTYNGVAKIYEDKECTKRKCAIKYNAKVKAGVNMSDVEFNVDKDKKVVTILLPDIEIKSEVVDDQSISFLPSDTRMDLKEALTECEKDVAEEAINSKELFKAAEENLKSTLEALLFPILDTEGYSIEWA